MAAILPLFIRSRRYRLCQQILNIVVLGFWCGTFMSWSAIIGYMSNGMNVITLLLPILLLIVAFIYPLFGKKNYYCTNVCPYGGLQEIVGKSVKFKVRMSSKIIKNLNTFRKVLFAIAIVFALLSTIVMRPYCRFVCPMGSLFKLER